MAQEGLCKCGFNTDHPEGAFCPKCGKELFMRPLEPQPASEPPTRVDTLLHDAENLPKKLSAVTSDKSRTAVQLCSPTQDFVAELQSLGTQSTSSIGDKRTEHGNITFNEATSELDGAVVHPSKDALPSLPSANSHNPAHGETNDHNEPRRGRPAQSSTVKQDESPSPLLPNPPPKRTQVRRRSRSPRVNEDHWDVQQFRNRTYDRLEPHQSTVSHHNERNLADGMFQQKSQARQYAGERHPLDRDYSVEPATVEHNGVSRCVPVYNQHLELEAAVQQLLDEERVRSEEDDSQPDTMEVSLIGGRAPPSIDKAQIECQAERPPASTNHQTLDAPRGQRKQLPKPLYQGDLVHPGRELQQQTSKRNVWCLLCHQRGHTLNPTCPDDYVQRADLRVERDWSTYYDNAANGGIHNPRTINHAINISVRLGRQLNKFDNFIQERDGFLLHVGQYLRPRIGTGTYQAWESCLDSCTTTVDTYMVRLMGISNQFQFNVVIKQLFHAAKCRARPGSNIHKRRINDLSYENQAQLIDRGIHQQIDIERREYEKSLSILNQARDGYKKACADAIDRIRDLFKQNSRSEARHVKKIRMAFNVLEWTLLDAGSAKVLNVISPNDFALPNVLRLRLDFEALDDDDRQSRQRR